MKRMRAMYNHPVYGIVFSPNGRSLVSASSDLSACIWNVRDGFSKVLPVTGSPDHFISVAFSPDGRYVAAGNFYNSIWIWDSRTHRLMAKWRGHTNIAWCMVFTADGKGLVSGGEDQMVKYWDVSLLGNRQGVTSGMVVNEEDGFPLVRNFSSHSVRFVQSFSFIL